MVTQVRDMWVRKRTRLYLIPSADLVIARERARHGDHVIAIPAMRTAVEELFQIGQLGACVTGAATLVETLLERGAENDIVEARSVIERLANVSDYDRSALCDIWLLRLSALLSRARGDDVTYQHLVNRYRTMAESFGFEGHIAMAEAM